MGAFSRDPFQKVSLLTRFTPFTFRDHAAFFYIFPIHFWRYSVSCRH
jgi:hypothetical protein